MAVRVEDLVKKDGPLTERQIELVQKWIDEDWESHDHDRNVVRLVQRLVHNARGQNAKP